MQVHTYIYNQNVSSLSIKKLKFFHQSLLFKVSRTLKKLVYKLQNSVYIYIYRGGQRIFPRGGTNPGAKRPRKFCPPPEHFRGGTGGGQGGDKCSEEEKSSNISKERYSKNVDTFSLKMRLPIIVFASMETNHKLQQLQRPLNIIGSYK